MVSRPATLLHDRVRQLSRTSTSSIARALTIAVTITCVTTNAASAEPTVRIYVRAPVAEAGAPRVTRVDLLMAWWGATERLPLHVTQNAHEAIVTVPLDASAWQRFDARHPDFAYVYVEFDGYVPVRSSRIEWTDTGPDEVGFRGGPRVSVAMGEQKRLTLVARRPAPRTLRVVDDAGKPVTDATLKASMFWSDHNHCGFPAGAETLFEGRRPDADGRFAVPDADIGYLFDLRLPHMDIVEPPARVEAANETTMFFAGRQAVIRIRRHIRVPLDMRVLVGGHPAGDVPVAAHRRSASCGYSGGILGRTEPSGAFHVDDFYPEEIDAICVGVKDDAPVWSGAPSLHAGTITIDLPAGTAITDAPVCFPRRYVAVLLRADATSNLVLVRRR